MASWTTALAFDFSGPLQAVEASLLGNTVTYRVSDPGRGVREGSWTGASGFISQPTIAGGLVAWLAGSTVHYRIYDPGPGTWREGSTTSPGGVYVSEPKNFAGVVAWVAGTNVYYRVYDPAFGTWMNGSSSSNPNTIISDPNNRDGVVVWVAGSTVQYRVYDPNLAVWKEGSHATPGMIIFDPANAGGVVAWAAGNSVYYRIYDPGRAAWRTNSWPGSGEYISNLQISNGTVTWTAGSQNYVRGYNPSSGAWTSGATLPYASFAAFPMSGNAPLFVWFTDLSFGASSWAWNFGDGGASGQRIPFHTFTSFGRFTVTQTVSGPAGTASANKIIQSDISPPTGSILINGGATHTRSNSVTLTLSAIDNSGGPMMMRFSNNGSTWNDWVAFVPSYPWFLSSGDGLKTVYAQFKDASDNISTSYSDTITLDTRPLPTISLNTNVVAVSENVPSVMFTVILSASSVFTVTVDYATGGGSATAGSDYSSLNGSLTFVPGETNKTLNLAIFNDTLVEPNETLVLNLSNPGNAILGAYATATVTILDNDRPLITFFSSNFTVDESGSHAVITVSLNAESGMAVSVTYATTNGTATAGSDYAAVAGRLDFMPGQVTRTFNVPLSDDNVDEPDETVFLKLSSPSNATLGAVSTATLTILDDDLPRASFSSDLFFVDEGTSEAIITIQLSNPYAQPVYVSYSTANGTALAGSDYSAASGTLVFSQGQTTRTFGVTILDDSVDETNETVRLNITGLINATPGSITSSILTILDNASRPLLISPRIQPGGIFQFSLIGPTGRRYALEASSNLVNWLELMRRTNLSGQVEFTDPATSRWRFYRAKQLD